MSLGRIERVEISPCYQKEQASNAPVPMKYTVRQEIPPFDHGKYGGPSAKGPSGLSRFVRQTAWWRRQPGQTHTYSTQGYVRDTPPSVQYRVA